MRALRRLVEARRDLVEDRVRLTNRLTHAQGLLSPGPRLVSRQGDGSLRRLPRALADPRGRPTRPPRHARRLLPRSQRALRSRHRAPHRGHPFRAPADHRRRRHRAGVACSSRRCLPQLRAASAGIERFDDEIARRCRQLPDYELFATLPGAGPRLAPRACWSPSESAASASPTPPPCRSTPASRPSPNAAATSTWVHWRFSCPTFLRQTFVEWVGQTIPRSFWARAFYDSHRAKGASHNAALRALAFKWIRILYRCWVDRTPYDEARYLLALQKRHAPLLKFAAARRLRNSLAVRLRAWVSRPHFAGGLALQLSAERRIHRFGSLATRPRHRGPGRPRWYRERSAPRTFRGHPREIILRPHLIGVTLHLLSRWHMSSALSETPF